MKKSKLKDLAKKMEQVYQIGAKVNWGGEFISGFQSGTGVISGHYTDGVLGLIWVRILTDSNTEKRFVVADMDNDNFKPKGISLA